MQKISQGDLSSIAGTYQFIGSGSSGLSVQFKSDGSGRFVFIPSSGVDISFKNFNLQNGVISFKHSNGPGRFYIVPAGVEFNHQFSRMGDLPTDKSRDRVIFVEHQVMYFYLD